MAGDLRLCLSLWNTSLHQPGLVSSTQWLQHQHPPPAGRAGGEDDASDSALPSFSMDRGETEMDAGNKRERQRANNEPKCKHRELVRE